MIVVFDIGNVLVRWDRRNLFRKVFSDEAQMECFLATACSMDFVAHTDVATNFSQAIAERAKTFPKFAEALRLFDARWIETLGGPIDENVALLRRRARPTAQFMRSATSPPRNSSLRGRNTPSLTSSTPASSRATWASPSPIRASTKSCSRA